MRTGRKRAEELAPGDTVGPYQLEELLGQGGMGVVFRAQTRQGDSVALKVLKPELSHDETYRRRFDHEVRAAREVEHRHLVPVLDADEASGYHYIAVTYVPGQSLDARIRQGGPLQLEEVVRIAVQVAAGLDALHDRDLVHRDVKPSNIMIDPNGDAMLTDFGLARGRGYTVLTRPGQVMGTVDYLAPELIRGASASRASDVYALACTLYECVAGSPPFAGKSIFEAAAAHIDEEPAELTTVRDELPEGLSWALLHGLAKDPDRRPPTATAYANLIVAAAFPGRRLS